MHASVLKKFNSFTKSNEGQTFLSDADFSHSPPFHHFHLAPSTTRINFSPFHLRKRFNKNITTIYVHINITTSH